MIENDKANLRCIGTSENCSTLEIHFLCLDLFSDSFDQFRVTFGALLAR